MKRRAAKELFDYWTAVRRGRTAPTGASFDPSAVRAAMREGFYLDARAPGAAVFSWLGGELERALPCARRGAGFLDIWGPDAVDDAARLLDVARRPCPVIVGAWGCDRDGVSRFVEVLALPLLADPSAPASARLIGVVAGVAEAAPIERLEGVTSVRILDDSTAPWRNAGFGARRRRDGWSAYYADLKVRARDVLGARLSAPDETDLYAPASIDASSRMARHLTVINGGKAAQKTLT